MVRGGGVRQGHVCECVQVCCIGGRECVCVGLYHVLLLRISDLFPRPHASRLLENCLPETEGYTTPTNLPTLSQSSAYPGKDVPHETPAAASDSAPHCCSPHRRRPRGPSWCRWTAAQPWLPAGRACQRGLEWYNLVVISIYGVLLSCPGEPKRRIVCGSRRQGEVLL